MANLPKPMTAECALRLFFDHTGAQLAQDGLGRVGRTQWRRDMTGIRDWLRENVAAIDTENSQDSFTDGESLALERVADEIDAALKEEAT